MPALAGIKRLREDYDDDLNQFQVCVQQYSVTHACVELMSQVMFGIAGRCGQRFVCKH